MMMGGSGHRSAPAAAAKRLLHGGRSSFQLDDIPPELAKHPRLWTLLRTALSNKALRQSVTLSGDRSDVSLLLGSCVDAVIGLWTMVHPLLKNIDILSKKEHLRNLTKSWAKEQRRAIISPWLFGVSSLTLFSLGFVGAFLGDDQQDLENNGKLN